VLEERRRIAHDLHDGLAQELACFARNLDSLAGDHARNTTRRSAACGGLLRGPSLSRGAPSSLLAAPCPVAGWVQRLREGNLNDGLFWAANRALGAGLTDLGELAEAARKTGLGEREIARTLASTQRRADRPFGAEPPADNTARRGYLEVE
jgi:histidine kinase